MSRTRNFPARKAVAATLAVVLASTPLAQAPATPPAATDSPGTWTQVPAPKEPAVPVPSAVRAARARHRRHREPFAARSRRRLAGGLHARAGAPGRRGDHSPDPRARRLPERPRGQRLSERARLSARQRLARRQAGLRVLRGAGSADQCVRSSRRLHRRAYRPHRPRPERIRARRRPRARDLARHAAPHRAHDRQPEELDVDDARRPRARDPCVARRRQQQQPGDARRDRRHAGAGRAEPAQLHARQRVRGRPRRLLRASPPPDSIPTRRRRSWSGCSATTASSRAIRLRTCARTPSPTSASRKRRLARKACRTARSRTRSTSISCARS